MKRPAFTMIELLAAMMILSVVTALSVVTFNTITESWTRSTEYLDKAQRSDYALEQVICALKSLYYPHDGEAGDGDYTYGFYLTDNGDGKDPGSSDVIEWAKVGPTLVGNKDATVDTVHRVQLMVLEEGDRRFKDSIEKTGLYVRMCPDPNLRPAHDKKVRETDYTFANEDLYQPQLIADGIVGFNCRVLPDAKKGDKDVRNAEFEDEWATSNKVPYKVELTFWIADPEGKSYRTNTAPMMRIVRMPMFEQAQDRKALPGPGGPGGPAGPGGPMGGPM